MLSGMDLTVRCRAHGQPVPQVSWLKNGTKITPDADQRFSFQEDSFHIRNLTEADSGTITCSASNAAGTATHDSLVNVIGESCDDGPGTM